MRRRLQLAPAPAALGRRGTGPPRATRHPRRRRRSGGRRAPARPPRGVHPACGDPAGVDPAVAGVVAPATRRRHVAVAQGAGGDQPLRGGRLRPIERRSGLPQPHVPLPTHRRALRRNVAGGRARVPGARRSDVLGRPRLGEDPVHRPPGAPRVAIQLPLDGPGPARVGRGGADHPPHPQPPGPGAVRRR